MDPVARIRSSKILRTTLILAPAESEGSGGSGSNSDGSGRIRLFQGLWKEDPMDPVARIRSSKILRTTLVQVLPALERAAQH